jgi:hypothetical protein
LEWLPVGNLLKVFFGWKKKIFPPLFPNSNSYEQQQQVWQQQSPKKQKRAAMRQPQLQSRLTKG